MTTVCVYLRYLKYAYRGNIQMYNLFYKIYHQTTDIAMLKIVSKHTG